MTENKENTKHKLEISQTQHEKLKHKWIIIKGM